jgi:hypothetical protein
MTQQQMTARNDAQVKAIKSFSLERNLSENDGAMLWVTSGNAEKWGGNYDAKNNIT